MLWFAVQNDYNACGGDTMLRDDGGWTKLRSTAPTAGLGFLWAWIYCAWFTPALFGSAAQASSAAQDETSWLVSMVLSGAILLVLCAVARAWVPSKGVVVLSAVGTSAGTVLLALSGALGWARLAGAVITGACTALMWFAWGVASARLADVRRIVPASAAVTGACVVLALVLPAPLSTAFVIALPLVSGALCVRLIRGAAVPGEALADDACGLDRVKALRALVGLCAASLVACGISAFAQTSTPALPALLPVGVLGAMVVVAVASYVPIRCARPFNYARPVRLLLLAEAVMLALLVCGGEACSTAGYVLAVGVSACFDFLLFMFFTTYIQRGFFGTVTAFCTSEALIQLGWAAGSVAALVVRHVAGVPSLPAGVFAALMCVLFCALLFVTDNQGAIEKIALRSVSEEAVLRLTREAGLSKREAQVLQMLGQGRSIPYISDALFLARSTVETHKKHLYAKLDVHSRQELISLLEEAKEPSFDLTPHLAQGKH